MTPQVYTALVHVGTSAMLLRDWNETSGAIIYR